MLIDELKYVKSLLNLTRKEKLGGLHWPWAGCLERAAAAEPAPSCCGAWLQESLWLPRDLWNRTLEINWKYMSNMSILRHLKHFKVKKGRKTHSSSDWRLAARSAPLKGRTSVWARRLFWTQCIVDDSTCRKSFWRLVSPQIFIFPLVFLLCSFILLQLRLDLGAFTLLVAALETFFSRLRGSYLRCHSPTLFEPSLLGRQLFLSFLRKSLRSNFTNLTNCL